MTTAVLLVAHGSPQAAANREVTELVSQLRERGRHSIVEPAFLEGASPSIPQGIAACVAQGASRVVVIPYFLLLGKHVLQDIPALVEEARARYPQVEFAIGQHLGAHPLLLDIALERLREAQESPDRKM